jgi:hypothetical protein
MHEMGSALGEWMLCAGGCCGIPWDGFCGALVSAMYSFSTASLLFASFPSCSPCKALSSKVVRDPLHAHFRFLFHA